MSVIRLENALLPTFVLTGDSSVDEINKESEGLITEDNQSFACFILTDKGPYTYRGTVGLMDSLTPAKKLTKIDGLSSIGDSEALINWTGEKIPLNIFMECQKFFRDIFDKYAAEAAIVLYYHTQLKDWKALYPIQVGLSGGSVTYVYNFSTDDELAQMVLKAVGNDINKLAAIKQVDDERNALENDGYIRLGTIHSHCDFSAFHSGVDDNDEANFDGLHITVGKLRSGLDYAQRVMGDAYFITLDSIADAVQIDGNGLELLNNIDSINNPLENFQSRCFTNITRTTGKAIQTPYHYPLNTSSANNHRPFWMEEAATYGGYEGYTCPHNYKNNRGNNYLSTTKNYNRRYTGDAFMQHNPPEEGDIVEFYFDSMTQTMCGKLIEIDKEHPGKGWIEVDDFKYPILVDGYDIIDTVTQSTDASQLSYKSEEFFYPEEDVMDVLEQLEQEQREEGLTWQLTKGQKVRFTHNQRICIGRVLNTAQLHKDMVCIKPKNKKLGKMVIVSPKNVLEILSK